MATEPLVNLENAQTIQWGTFIDVDMDVVQYLQLPSVTTQQQYLLQLMTDAACQWAQEYLGRPLGPTSFFRRFDGMAGWGGVHIMLPYSPVLEIVSVTETRGSSGDFLLPESSVDYQVDGWDCTYQTGRLTRVFPGNIEKPWFPGHRNISVQWIGGVNPVPSHYKLATLELIAYWYRNSQQASGPGAAVQSQYGEPQNQNGMTPWGGVPSRVELFFEQAIRIGMG